MILNHVWDQSFEGVTNIVDVYVRYLRRKVDEPFPVSSFIPSAASAIACATRSRNNTRRRMNHRSLAFRLGAWYTLLLSATFVLVAAGTFFGLQHYLRSNLRDSLSRRSTQVEQILIESPADGPTSTIAQEIETGSPRNSTIASSGHPPARDCDLSFGSTVR